ncbi:MAG TPA: sulfotransferase [Gemmatimonadales bacterium]|nr:sulfotransferase [Gemmatimonadales bacterium]
MNPYVFVVGCQRSGTTLLQQMLDAHPELAVTCDSEFIPLMLQDARETGAPAAGDATLHADTVELLIAYRSRSGRAGFQRLGLKEEDVRQAAAGAETYAGFVTRLFDAVAASRGKPYAGDKTPDYARSIPLLHRLFPQARFVHIVRDGRDVALSLQRWAQTAARGPVRTAVWKEEPVAACALWWSGMVTSAERGSSVLSAGQYLTIRYEDLIAQPEATLIRVTAFLDLPFAPAMLRYYESKRQVRRPGHTSMLPPTAGLRDWRKELAPGGVAVFEYLAGDLLAAHGYERTVVEFPPELQARAANWRRRWRKKFGQAGDLPPPSPHRDAV